MKIFAKYAARASILVASILAVGGAGNGRSIRSIPANIGDFFMVAA